MNPSASLGEAPLDRGGAIALLVACAGWSIGTVVSKRLVLPQSKPMSAAAQMLSGGVQLLVLAVVTGEFGRFQAQAISGKAWLSLVYLIIAGSIISYTAYVWLLEYESPTKVGTYAYVNPVVAVILGAAIGGETIGRRTLLGMALILVSVVAITTMKAKQNSMVADAALATQGNVDFGATSLEFLQWAYLGIHDFAKDSQGARRNVRVIANIPTPTYFVAAAKADSGITGCRRRASRSAAMCARPSSGSVTTTRWVRRSCSSPHSRSVAYR